jgi:hypothetical protein
MAALIGATHGPPILAYADSDTDQPILPQAVSQLVIEALDVIKTLYRLSGSSEITRRGGSRYWLRDPRTLDLSH